MEKFIEKHMQKFLILQDFKPTENQYYEFLVSETFNQILKKK